MLTVNQHRTSSSRPSFGRTVLATVIALSMVLAFFHGWTGSSEAEELSVSSAISVTDNGPQVPQQAPLHSDHCLTHLVSDIRQVPAVAVPIRFADAAYACLVEIGPPGHTGNSPFKPPRA